MNISLGRYCVRSYEDSDARSLAKHANNRNVWRTLTDLFPHPYTEEDARNWIQHVRSQERETQFAIADDTEVFGGIGFYSGQDIRCKTAVLGYWIGESYWNRGIMSKVVPAFTDYMFKHFSEIARIQAEVFEGNTASGRILEKTGFLQEACLRKAAYKDGRLLDDLVYGMLREEWEAHNNR